MKRIVLLLASAALAVLLVSSLAGADATITFAPAKNFPAGDSPRAVAAADLDKDGDTDIMTVHNAIDRVSVLKRRADGPRSDTPPPTLPPTSWAGRTSTGTET
jgi:hypothetical protein